MSAWRGSSGCLMCVRRRLDLPWGLGFRWDMSDVDDVGSGEDEVDVWWYLAVVPSCVELLLCDPGMAP